MYHLSKFINSSQGRILMSILIGIGLSALFRDKCKNKMCKVLHSPQLAEVSETVYKYGRECFQFDPVPRSCSDKEFYPAAV